MPTIKNTFQQRYRLKKIAHICNNWTSNYSKLLDIGYAALPNPFLSKDKFFITGIDKQPNNNNYHYNNELIMDATNCLNPLGYFDIIIASEFIEHIENPYSFMKNILKISKNDSLLIISTPNPLGFPILFFEIINSHKFFYCKNHTYYFLPRWLERIAEYSGWKLINKIGVKSFFLPQPLILCNQIIYIFKPK